MKPAPRQDNEQTGNPQRILELQRKIRDRTYLDYAVERLAFVMTSQIFEGVQIDERKM